MLRGGQGFSTRTPKKTDIIIRRIGGGGRRSSRKTFTPPSVNVRLGKMGEVFINGQGFSVRPSELSKFISSKGGLVTSTLQKQIKEQKRITKQRADERIRKAQAVAQAEKVKIENLRRELLRKGNQERTQILKNREGQRIQRSIVKNRSQDSRVIISRNLDTGEVSYKSYGRPGQGYYVQQTGGVTITTSKEKKIDQDIKQVKEAKKEAEIEGKPTGKLDKLLVSLESKKDLLRSGGAGKFSSRIFDPEREMLSALTALSTIVVNVIAFRDLPKTVKAIVKNPKILKSIPSAVKGSVIDFGRLIKVSPNEAIAKIGTELLLLKGTGKIVSSTGKLTGMATAKLSTKFVGTAKVGTALKVTTKAGRKIDLDIVGRLGSKGLPKETIAKQVLRAGKKSTGVSAQADELVKFVRRKKLIKKPLGTTKTGQSVEEALSKTGKKLLNKFDEGKITSKEVVQLDKLIKQKGGGGILERSFFVDPEARVRPSRLGIQKEASITDIFSRDFTFRKQKPQILVFDKVQVQKFPKGFEKIVSKLKNKKTLSSTEADKLLQFQLKKSGKFKPLGFISGEAELTLAAGEVIKRVKKIGVTLVRGRKVNIIEARVIKTTGRFNNLLKKFQKGIKLTSKEKKELNRLLKSKTGFKGGLSSRKLSTKRVSIKKIGATTLSRTSRGIKRVKKISRVGKISRKTRRTKRISKISRTFKSSKSSRKGKPSKSRRGKLIKLVSKPSGGRVIRRSRKGKPIKPIKLIRPISTKGFKQKKLSKKILVFLVKVKRKGKIVNLTPKPLRLNHAKDLLAYKVDHHLIRSGWFQPIGKAKVVVIPPKNILGYYNRVKHKLRPYRIKDKRKKMILNGYIEKRPYIIDQKSEKLELKLSRKKKS